MKKNIFYLLSIFAITALSYLSKPFQIYASTAPEGSARGDNLFSINNITLFSIPILLAIIFILVILVYYFYNKSKKVQDNQVKPPPPLPPLPPQNPIQ